MEGSANNLSINSKYLLYTNYSTISALKVKVIGILNYSKAQEIPYSIKNLAINEKVVDTTNNDTEEYLKNQLYYLCIYPNANYGYEVIQRVPNVDAVSACRVPLDGRVSYFVLNDNSAICTKFIDMNGKAVIRKYVLQETPSNNKTIEERIANLEGIVESADRIDAPC